MIARALALAVIAVGVSAAIVGTALPMFVADVPEQLRFPRDLAFPALFLAVGFNGAVILRYRSTHPLGWILGVSSIVGAVEHVLAGYTAVAVFGGGLPGGTVTAWVFSWLEIFHLAPLATLALLVFPTGTLPSKRWRPVAWLAIGDMVALAAVLMVLPAPIPVFETSNPFALTAAANILYPLAGALFALLAVLTIASAASVARRYRRSTKADRQRIKWVALAGLVVIPSTAVIVALGLPLELSALLATVAYIPIPVAMTIGIVRYRLFDIDRLIDRALVYGSVSAVLVATYVIAVVALQAALAPITDGSDLSVAGSTLLVVALFQPLRARVQNAVDRRFYRSRYDASRTLDAFVARLRDEVGLDEVRSEVLDVVAATVRPAHAGLWLREGPTA